MVPKDLGFGLIKDLIELDEDENESDSERKNRKKKKLQKKSTFSKKE